MPTAKDVMAKAKQRLPGKSAAELKAMAEASQELRFWAASQHALQHGWHAQHAALHKECVAALAHDHADALKRFQAAAEARHLFSLAMVDICGICFCAVTTAMFPLLHLKHSVYQSILITAQMAEFEIERARQHDEHEQAAAQHLAKANLQEQQDAAQRAAQASADELATLALAERQQQSKARITEYHQRQAQDDAERRAHACAALAQERRRAAVAAAQAWPQVQRRRAEEERRVEQARTERAKAAERGKAAQAVRLERIRSLVRLLWLCSHVQKWTACAVISVAVCLVIH
jgi:hypothetical protein